MAVAQTFVCMIVLLAAVIPYAHSVAFHFDSFSPGAEGLILQGDASISSGVIQLTRNNKDNDLTNSSGRALYSEAIQIWDKDARVANFKCQFSLAIERVDPQSDFADGITFFLSALPAEMPQNSFGGSLGLFDSKRPGSDKDQILAIEFDTYVNGWDPKYRHVGIDVHNITSVTETEWQNIIFKNGGRGTVDVTVSYYSVEKLLQVSWTDIERTLILSHKIDITEVLPAWVFIGFSGATGQLVQINNVLSWSFISDLCENKVIRLNEI